MRLLLVTASFHPTIGGAETYAYDMARLLVEAGHAVAVVTDLPRGLALGEHVAGDPPGVLVHRLSGYRLLLNDESKIHWEQLAFGLLPELLEVVQRFKPNVVLSNSLDTALFAKMIELELGIPWAATFHEQAPEIEALGIGRVRLVYEVLRPNLVLAGSEFYAARARRWGCGERVIRIYHGVNTDVFHPTVDGREVRRRYGISPDELLIVCAGRLKPRKGMLELICALGQIAVKRPEIRLLIVGSVSSASRHYADQLRVEAERLGAGSVVLFDETVTHGAMPSVLAAADIVAQPSLEEGLGLSVIEAMASGKPVVMTDIPGFREITTTPDVALVVPPGDTAALADALTSLVDNKVYRHSLGERGREHALHHFSRVRMGQETEEALLRLLKPDMEKL